MKILCHHESKQEARGKGSMSPNRCVVPGAAGLSAGDRDSKFLLLVPSRMMRAE